MTIKQAIEALELALTNKWLAGEDLQFRRAITALRSMRPATGGARLGRVDTPHLSDIEHPMQHARPDSPDAPTSRTDAEEVKLRSRGNWHGEIAVQEAFDLVRATAKQYEAERTLHRQGTLR